MDPLLALLMTRCSFSSSLASGSPAERWSTEWRRSCEDPLAAEPGRTGLPPRIGPLRSALASGVDGAVT